MITFGQLKENISGKTVYDKNIGKYPVKVIDTKDGFDLLIDGDKLDTYKTLKDAMKNAKSFVSELEKSNR